MLLFVDLSRLQPDLWGMVGSGDWTGEDLRKSGDSASPPLPHAELSLRIASENLKLL